MQGLAGYPVFTRKAHTDISYLACARAMLEARRRALSDVRDAQRAHDRLGRRARGGDAASPSSSSSACTAWARRSTRRSPRRRDGVACRVYAPVGSHQDLLPYLVRRLLENGANTSFVNRIADPAIAIDDVVADPVLSRASMGLRAGAGDSAARRSLRRRAPQLGRHLARRPGGHGRARRRARAGEGVQSIAHADAARDRRRPAPRATLYDPADRRVRIGTAVEADARPSTARSPRSAQVSPTWDARGGVARAEVLERAADAIEARPRCLRRAARARSRQDARRRDRRSARGGRFLPLLRAAARGATSRGPPRCRRPPASRTRLALRGRGVFACISPWNFPLAIFTGQVAAALAAGNAVAAKPAEQTPLAAALAVRCLLDAGVPADALALLPGAGETVGAALVGDPRVAGVAFTGSTTSRARSRASSPHATPLVPLIAETGGQNAMIVDSSALPEQVVADAVFSAFNSAGQRCSALRVLCVQEEIAPRVIELIEGAMDELAIGDPALAATDVGPVIDDAARDALEALHRRRCARKASPRHRAALPAACAHGTFVAPTLIAPRSARPADARGLRTGAARRRRFAPARSTRWSTRSIAWATA